MAETFTFGNKDYRKIEVNLADLYPNHLQRDGYYHLDSAVFSHSMGEDDSVIFSFNQPVAIEGSLPEKTRILAVGRGKHCNLKLIGDKVRSNIIGEGSIIIADGIDAENMLVSRDTILLSGNNPIQLFNCEIDSRADIKTSGALSIKKSQFNQNVLTQADTIIMSDCNIGIENSMKAVNGNIIINGSYLSGESTIASKSGIILKDTTVGSDTLLSTVYGDIVADNTTFNRQCRIHNSKGNTRLSHCDVASDLTHHNLRGDFSNDNFNRGGIEQRAKASSYLPVPIPTSADKFKDELNQISPRDIKWEKINLKGCGEVLATAETLQNTAGAIYFLSEILDMTLPNTHLTKGKVAIPTEKITEEVLDKLKNADITSFTSFLHAKQQQGASR